MINTIEDMRISLLEEISNSTGIPIEDIKKMDLHEIEERLDLKDGPPCEGLYKFVSKDMMKRREDKITKILEEYKKERVNNR